MSCCSVAIVSNLTDGLSTLTWSHSQDNWNWAPCINRIANGVFGTAFACCLSGEHVLSPHGPSVVTLPGWYAENETGNYTAKRACKQVRTLETLAWTFPFSSHSLVASKSVRSLNELFTCSTSGPNFSLAPCMSCHTLSFPLLSFSKSPRTTLCIIDQRMVYCMLPYQYCCLDAFTIIFV